MSDKTRVYVSVMVSNPQGKLLILQRSNSARFAPGQWEFVNGTPEPHESAEETAVREVLEETGIALNMNNLRSFPPCELTDTDGRWIVIPYSVQIKEHQVKTSHEHQNYKWVTESELLATPVVGDDYKIVMEQTHEF